MTTQQEFEKECRKVIHQFAIDLEKNLNYYIDDEISRKFAIAALTDTLDVYEVDYE